MNSLRLVYFGTPEFAVPTLERLLDRSFTVAAVITQPDRPRGRGQKPSAGPVKAIAQARGVPVLQPDRLKDESFLEEFRRLSPDLGIVAAYGKILPQALLEIPRLGLVNVHASLLPRWRGASPIHRAVMSGDRETGISIMRVVRELDAGPVFAVARRAIGPDETSAEVEADLASLGADLLVSIVPALAAGTADESPQDESGVSYAPRLTKEEGLIAWGAPAEAIHNQIRGLQPWPHAYTFLERSRIIVLRSSLLARQTPEGAKPGEVLAIDGEGITVAAGDGRPLQLLFVQLEGRRAVSGRQFAAGTRLKAGTRLGIWP